jgi:dTDP-4-amino-4,6-dideoxygalactose transaminase
MKTKVPFNDLSRIHNPIKKDILKDFEKVVENSQFVLNEDIKKFEDSFAKFTQSKYSISCANGTDAIELILRALDISVGDEVIVPSNTFIATALAVSRTGATPIFVDNDSNYLISPEDVTKKINKRTKAVIGVHLYGQQADNYSLSTICKKNNLFYLEDSAQAHASLQNSSPPGKYGVAAAYSFYPGKNLGAWGDGGAITTNNKKLMLKILELRNWGSTKKYIHNSIGYNSRLQPIQGLVLMKKLQNLNSWTENRNSIALQYIEGLKDNRKISLPNTAHNNYHSWHLFVIRVSKRNRVIEELNSKGIQTVIHYPVPIHRQRAYKNHPQYKVDIYKSDQYASKLLSLPIFPKMTKSEIDYVIKTLNLVLNQI